MLLCPYRAQLQQKFQDRAREYSPWDWGGGGGKEGRGGGTRREALPDGVLGEAS